MAVRRCFTGALSVAHLQRSSGSSARACVRCGRREDTRSRRLPRKSASTRNISNDSRLVPSTLRWRPSPPLPWPTACPSRPSLVILSEKSHLRRSGIAWPCVRRVPPTSLSLLSVGGDDASRSTRSIARPKRGCADSVSRYTQAKESATPALMPEVALATDVSPATETSRSRSHGHGSRGQRRVGRPAAAAARRPSSGEQ